MKLSPRRLYSFVALVAALAAGEKAFAAAGPSPAATANSAPKAIPLTGQVLETMDGGGYTYVLLKQNSEKVWVAIPQMKVAVGQELNLAPGFAMSNFTSKGLNRKFDRVIFSAGPMNSGVKLSPSAVKMAHEKAQKNAGQKSAAQTPETPKPKPAKVGKITKAKGPNAYTIAQLYAQKKALAKKPVVVRGKVVKVSSKIMKRNWVHIEDGSGTAAKKNNDLIITTMELPKEGDVVTVRGTLHTNVNFGAGYRYDILLDQGRFKK